MKYLSIDIETTGLDPETCQILEIAVILDDLKKPLSGRPITDCPSFHCYVVHPQIQGQAYALSLHSEMLRRIAKREPGYLYVRPERMDWEVRHWLWDQDPSWDLTQSVMVAGKNFGSFDRQFLQRLPCWGLQFHHRSLDPALLYFDPQVDQELPSTGECLRRAGLDLQLDHTALADAELVIQLLRHKLLGETYRG